MEAKNNNHGFLLFCLSGWLICLGIQVRLPFIQLRFAISDIFVFLFVIFILFFRKKFIVKTFLTLDILLLLSLFAVSTIQHVLVVGKLTTYTLVNKDIGILVLFASFLLVVNSVKNTKDFFFATRIFVITTALLNLVYLFAYLPFCPVSAKEIFLFGELRLRGLLVDPNAYGGFLSVAFFMCLPLIKDAKKISKRIFNEFLLISLLLGIIMTTSRSTYLGFAAGLLIVSLLSRSLRKYVVFSVLFGMVLLVVALSVGTFGPTILSRITSVSQVNSRIQIIEAALKAFVHKPIFGWGLGSFFEFSKTYFGLPWKQIIHNTYLWFLADFGLVGFIIFLLFVFHVAAQALSVTLRFAKNGEPLFYSSVAITASLISLFVFAVGIEAFYQRHLWMLFGMLEVLGRMDRVEGWGNLQLKVDGVIT